MKKLLVPLVVIVVIGLVWILASNRRSGGTVASRTTASDSKSNPVAPSASTAASVGGTRSTLGSTTGSEIPAAVQTALSGDGEISEEDLKSATELYKSADEALKAVKDGAVDYDDLVLEQFTELGPECTWCESFYKSVSDLMLQEGTPADQKSYFAEILAVSGRVSNVKALVEAIKANKGKEAADTFSEALELTTGSNEVVNYLGTELKEADDALKEPLVAAITNQGSRNAAQLLYQNAVESKNPDGYYSVGIGLGELIPEPEAMPYLQEKMLQRDQYSPLAVKALLNGGLDGLRLVMDALSSSKDPSFDRTMLKGGVDHVNYEPEVEEYLKGVVQKNENPLQVEFANQILADFGNEQELDAEDDGGDDVETEDEAA